MGNAKNKNNSNANRGKYCKKRFTTVSTISTITEISLTENRIINLRTHMQEVTQHVATCQPCQDKAL